MGALLDSTYLVEAERAGLSPSAILRNASDLAGTQEFGISVITIMEMAHGEARADSDKRAEMRSQFLSELMRVLSIFPVTPEIARRAGLMDGQLAKAGQKLAFADVLIATTALEFGYSVVTRNLRHFDRIPDLQVIQHRARQHVRTLRSHVLAQGHRCLVRRRGELTACLRRKPQRRTAGSLFG